MTLRERMSEDLFAGLLKIVEGMENPDIVSDANSQALGEYVLLSNAIDLGMTVEELVEQLKKEGA